MGQFRPWAERGDPKSHSPAMGLLRLGQFLDTQPSTSQGHRAPTHHSFPEVTEVPRLRDSLLGSSFLHSSNVPFVELSGLPDACGGPFQSQLLPRQEWSSALASLTCHPCPSAWRFQALQCTPQV